MSRDNYIKDSVEHIYCYKKLIDIIMIRFLRDSFDNIDVSKFFIDENIEILEDVDEFYKTLKKVYLDIQNKEKESEQKQIFLHLKFIFKCFDFSLFEKFCFLISLVTTIDNRYKMIFSVLQDNKNFVYPSVSLCFKIFNCFKKSRFDELDFKNFCNNDVKSIVFGLFDDINKNKELVDKMVCVSERVKAFIWGRPFISSNIKSIVNVENVSEREIYQIANADIDRLLRNTIKYEKELMTIVLIKGDKGSGKKQEVRNIANKYKKPIIFVDFSLFIDDNIENIKIKLNNLMLEVYLTQGFVCFTNVLAQDIIDDKKFRVILIYLYEYLCFFIMLTDDKNLKLDYYQDDKYLFNEIIINDMDESKRFECWKSFMQEYNINYEDLEKLSRGFILNVGKIKNISQKFGLFKTDNYDKNISLLKRMCISNSSYNFGDLAFKVRQDFNWDDIILDDDCKTKLINICNRIKYKHKVYNEWGFINKSPYGNGISMLFYGQSGTGKTMAAQIMAKQIGCELYKIDLSQIVDKYIGETEKNLKKIFNNASKTNVMLFFDEADSIFSKRTQISGANDRYANVETAYLLQKIEEYEGVCILATNFLVSFDDAFRRRIKFMINFKMPDLKNRLLLWKKSFPEKINISPDVDFERISEKYEITGSSIKSVAIAAAFYAAAENKQICMKYINMALKDELEKSGKILLQHELEIY